MVKALPVLALALTLAAAGCSKRVDLEKVPVGTEVQVTRQDGGVVQGTLAGRDDTTVRIKAGSVTRAVPRDQITEVQLVDTTPATLPAIAKFREFTIPEGTRLDVRLESAVASDASRVGDPVQAILTSAVVVDGTDVLPAGSVVNGDVAEVASAGKVKGRASLALQFTSIAVTGRDEQYPIAARVSWQGASNKGKDAATIAIPAAGGAIIGGLIGGGKGAAIGAAVGGGGGTAVALSTRGPQVRLHQGAVLSLRLDQAVEVRVPIKKT